MNPILHALSMASPWSVRAVAGKEPMTRLLPDDSPKTLTVACALGAASTNLVAELGIIMSSSSAGSSHSPSSSATR